MNTSTVNAPATRLADARIAFRFESGEFSGPFLAEREASGALTLWPLTSAAWSIGSLAPRSVVVDYYGVAKAAFSAPDATPCRTTNDPVDCRILASAEIEQLVSDGVLLPGDEARGLIEKIENHERYLHRLGLSA